MIEALFIMFFLGLLVGAAAMTLYFLNRRETEVERKLSEIQSVLGSVQDAASLNLQMEKCRASGLWPKEMDGLNTPSKLTAEDLVYDPEADLVRRTQFRDGKGVWHIVEPPYVLNDADFSGGTDDTRGHA